MLTLKAIQKLHTLQLSFSHAEKFKAFTQFCIKIENLAFCGIMETITKEFKRHPELLEASNE